MKQLLPILLMILFINGFVRAAEDTEMDKQEYFPISFTNKLTILDWSKNLYAVVEKLLTNHRLPTEDIKKIQKVIQTYVTELDILEGKMDISELESVLPREYHEMNEKFMSRVDRLYDHIVTHGFHKQNIGKIDSNFTSEISNSIQELPKLLNETHQFLEDNVRISRSGALHVIQFLDPNEPNHVCLDVIPRRHKTYLFYCQVLLTEMKGFAALLQMYAWKVSVYRSQEDYTEALIALDKNFDRRLDRYHSLFTQIIGITSQESYRCHKWRPRRGIDFVELEHFSRLQILSLLRPIPKSSCGNCTVRLPRRQLRNDLMIYNCRNAENTMVVCPPATGSSRDFMWAQGPSQQYGSRAPCQLQYHMIPDAIDLDSNCPLCACSVDLSRSKPDFSHAIYRFSVTEQISDIWNNMVVTGVKFVTRDNAIHLQIQQAKFSDDALSSSTPVWKELDIKYDQGNENVTEMKYEPLSYHRKTLFLDAVALPDGHVVTGIRFNLVQSSALTLQIHGTPFDLETGKLDVSNSQWYDAIDSPMKPVDYYVQRRRIRMDRGDDPTKAGLPVNYDLTSNKAIEFTHTDWKKDAGQTTIPLLDAQPVEAKQPFPLSGLGLFFRKVGDSGFVAPRVYTLNIIPYLKMEKVHNEVPVP